MIIVQLSPTVSINTIIEKYIFQHFGCHILIVSQITNRLSKNMENISNFRALGTVIKSLAPVWETPPESSTKKFEIKIKMNDCYYILSSYRGSN